MLSLIERITKVRREEGQTLVEYALILATISIGVTVALTFLRDELRGVFTTIGNGLTP